MILFLEHKQLLIFFYNIYIIELFDILRVILSLKELNDDNNKIFYIADLYSA